MFLIEEQLFAVAGQADVRIGFQLSDDTISIYAVQEHGEPKETEALIFVARIAARLREADVSHRALRRHSGASDEGSIDRIVLARRHFNLVRGLLPKSFIAILE